MRLSHSRRRGAHGSLVAWGVFWVLVVLLPAASYASDTAEPPRPRKKVQEVDLHRLEIQGRLDNPASVFLLEKGSAPLSNLWTLDGLLPVLWITHVDKETFDRCAASAAIAENNPSSSAAEDATSE